MRGGEVITLSSGGSQVIGWWVMGWFLCLKSARTRNPASGLRISPHTGHKGTLELN